MSHFEKRVELNKIIESQLPEFLVADFPKAVEFFRQYYISQEYQGADSDLINNLDRYIKIDNLVPEVVVGKTKLSSDITSSDSTITVSSTKGFPEEYGLLKINDEIITYTSKTDTTFSGCVRGFSGITGYNVGISSFLSDVNKQNVVFSTSVAKSHTQDAEVTNLSVLFLQEFYKKLKATFTPGLEDSDFVSDLNVGNFIKHARNFYQSKGIEESVKIIFKVLYGVDAKVLDLEKRLIKPSSAEYIRREVIVAENIAGDPFKLEGQTIFRSNDLNTNASVSDVEIFTRNNKTYYRLGLFVGYNDRDLVEGIFEVPGNSKALEAVTVGASVISVDSTIGFGQTGTLISGTNKIDYTSKSVNQFFGCSGVNSTISLGDDIRADETAFGYEDGDLSKRVDLRITGVLSDFVPLGDLSLIEEGEIITVRHLGEAIQNPNENKTYKQVFANSWIYNTSSRYKVGSIVGSTFTLLSNIDKSSLKEGDVVDVLFRNTNNVASADAQVTSINTATRQVILSNLSGFVPNVSIGYDIRRKLKKVTSSGASLLVGNNNYIANTLNVYSDDQGTTGYVASHSLPGYEIVDDIVESTLPNGYDTNLGGYNATLKTYSTIKFSTNVKFIDGDRITYTSDNPLSGLVSGETYFVKIVAPNEIQLFSSKALISGVNSVRFDQNTTPSVHRFTLRRHENRILSSNNILRKFPLKQELSKSSNPKRSVGNIGILIDGVEISSPESNNKIYYGPLEEFEVLNGGKDYDVINPPQITISTGAGVTALVEPIISGSVKEVFVDAQDFDVENVVSLSINGGNGSGCELQPILGDRFREIEFDSRSISFGGGIDIVDETITFTSNHNLADGQHIIYNQNGNNPLEIGTFGDITNAKTGTLVSGDEYVAKFVNTRTIKLFNNDSDALSGINTVGFSTATFASGIHKFRTLSTKTLRKVKVLSPGSGYQYRKLRVPSSGISTQYDTFKFENHGFEHGDIVTYSTTGTVVSGLSTSNQYSISKIDSDTFRLINVGVAATVTTDLTKSKYVDVQSVGSGYHIFQYPEITITANVSYGSTFSGGFTFTPVVTGEIIGSYLYEKGTGYGSDVLNLHKKPTITLKNGKDAQLNPIISNGRIVDVQVLSKGSEYFSIPEIVVEGSGSGAILRPQIVNGKLDDVIVINGGIGYDAATTTLYADARGSGAIFNVRIRSLTVNDAQRFGEYSKTRTPKIFSNLQKNDTDDYIVYGMYGYSEDLGTNLGDLNGLHSPIIGWAYDGNPIYGPYGYKDADDVQSGVKILNTGYTLDSTNIDDRPSTSTFSSGFFIDDYRYTNDGDLDDHNGRFCKTPEFPNGVYAYFVGVTTSLTSNKLEPSYPYFIGNTFRSDLIAENSTLDQTFDFNGSNLVRNTYPYKVNDPNADYDFFMESYEDFRQESVIESVTQGDVDDVTIEDGGTGYRIGERVNFDQSETGGTGFRAEVSELIGKDVLSIQTSLERYEGCVFVWDDNKQVSAYYRSGFDLNNNDSVLVSGLSTSVVNLAGSARIGFSTETVGLAATMSSYSSTPGGTIEDIFVSSIPNVAIGGSIAIKSSLGSETVRVLNNYQNGVLRVKRYASAGVAHSYSSDLNVLSDRVKIPAKTSKFESRRDDLVYFNANASVGIGTTLGGAVSKTFAIGNVSDTVSIPYRSIYLPGHPFKTGQRLTFTMSDVSGVNALIVGNDETNSGTFNLPDSFTRTADVYVINKSKDYIGLTTQVGLTTNSEGLFFYSDGTNNSEYLLKSNYDQITGDVDRISTLVSTASSHGLVNGDTIKLTVEPNTVVGFGTTAALSIKFNENDQKLLVNSVGINSSQINIATNTITLTDHGYKTGDKVYYSSVEVASGLTTGSYYVVRDSSSTFRLAETRYETSPNTENTVNIVGTGDTTHTFSLINPKIDVIRNSDLKFNLGDSSLRGYEFKIFYDREMKNEFVSVADDGTFNVVGVGSVGFGTATTTINYSENIPSKLYYTLEKSGYISTSDVDVSNYSQINYVDSEYNGSYKVFGISTNTFRISPQRLPSVLKYANDQVDKLEYTTKSSTAINGSIGKVKIISKGFNFNKLPKFTDVTTQDGKNANIVAVSTSIGNVKSVRIKDVGYDYPSDKTLRPEAFVPPVIRVDNLDTIDSIDIVFGGAKYLNAPDLLLFNETTKKVVDSTTLIADAPNGSVSDVIQIAPIYGLDSEPHKIVSINNSNGVGISSMVTSNSGVATCTLKTPILGFSSPQFTAGDKIYVEGIELIPGSTGSGYNSDNYDYRFFTVDSYQNTNPAEVTFSLVDVDGVGLTTNPGIAKTFQSGYATIVNEENYPIINVNRKRSSFSLNEQLFVNVGGGFFEEDVFVSAVRDDYIKITGRYSLQKGDKIKGKVSGAIAEVSSVNGNRAKFTIDYSSRKNIGWRNDIGKISEDYQVTPDNDYYQNLSYSIKSPIPWNTFVNPVNGILHPAGMKNFADVGITSVANNGVGLGGSTTSIAILDVVGERRVDIINNFDNAVDFDTRTNPDQSKFLKIQNRKLTDYTECRTNRVLIHDDISNKFSSRGFEDPFVEIEEIDIRDTHVRYLIQIVDPDTLDSQLSELVLQTSTIDSILFEKSTSFTNEKLGDFSANVDDTGRKTLLFYPTDIYNRDHDIKVLKKTFLNASAGLGTETFGSIRLTGSNVIGISSVGTASSIGTLLEVSDTNFNGLFANIEITNTFTKDVNYVEAILDINSNNTYLSEYYFDTKTQSYSANSLGIVTSIYDSTAGIVSFRVQNDTANLLDVRANIVGFANTTLGIGTHTFLVSAQPAASARSARLESTLGFGTDVVRVGTFDINTINSVSSLVRVSSGSSSAIHQVAYAYNGEEVVVTPGPFAASNNTTGLGTFGGQVTGSQFFLNFYPDSGYDVEVQGFNEVFYTESDFDNEPLQLSYGPSNQRLFLSAYDGINGARANKVNFPLFHEGSPIYKKTFSPSDTTIVDYATGVFTIRDHFFNTGEELIYTPKSTFIGIGESAMGIGATANYLGVVTDRLPERVYPIAITPDTFRLSTQRSFANAGIYVTFTDAGLGNAHELEFTKKLSKTVISLDGIVQQPITYTPISHTLQYNSGSISAGIATFNLSGISSVQPRDLLKIDDEYMKVVEVGVSTNVGGAILGPINGIISAGAAATFPTVSVVRASVGSTAVSHNDGANVQIYRGSINIVGNEVWFTDPPKGNTRTRRNESNLPYVRAQYSGRTFLRSNYATNMIFDDISNQFTGIGKTYTLSVQGVNTTGVDIGNGILFINGVFQTPTTSNNSGNNYEFENDASVGISSVVFTGITSTDGSFIKSEFDINQNQLPRGGLIVSLGSTPGLGYAPLVGAKVRAVLDGSGSIVDVISIGTTLTGASLGVSTASYDNTSGIIEIETTTAHGLVGGDRVKLVGLAFTCPTNPGITSYFPEDQPNYIDRSYDIVNILSSTSLTVNVGPSTIQHNYVGFGTVYEYFTLNNGSGYRSPVSIGITDPNHSGTESSISATVGAGGTLGFVINSGGSGYVEPYIDIPQPVYENMSVIGVSRLGAGSTTDTGSNLLLNVKIGSASTNVGIGSTLFVVESFEVARPGHSFRVGDVMKVVGLVTAKDFAQPISEFQLEVVETFNDFFSSWSFGEMDYIDSTRLLQNGSRTRFPLYYNGQLLSFEIDPNAPLSGAIDLDAVLVIFVNGVLQQPGVAYQFNGGTSFIFTEPPKSSDKVDIFFYLGQDGVDVTLIDVNETIKIGDDVFVKKHPLYSTTQNQLRDRTIVDLLGSDSVETDIYVGTGINETTFKPFDWIKQKTDKYIKGDIVYKTRDILEPQIFPTAKIIGDLNIGSTEIFVDNAQFFNYEEDNYGITINSVDGFIVQGTDPVSAAFTATVSAAGTISAITITNAGLGYSTASVDVKIAAPSHIGVGIGSTAIATATVAGGSVTSINIINPGLGYSTANPPQVITEVPKVTKETITTIQNVQGFSGIITGISTTTGTNGHPLALKINFRSNSSDANDLQAGYPLLVYNTTVGTGVTSVGTEDSSVIGIGTNFLDNVYIVGSKTNFGPNAEIVCNVHTNSAVIGIETSGSTTLPLGNISWGRLYNYDVRTSPVSIGVTGLTVDSGLSTYPTIQRRTFGLRNSGAIRKLSNI